MELSEYWFERGLSNMQSRRHIDAAHYLEHYKRDLSQLEAHDFFQFGRYQIFNVSYPQDHQIEVPLVWEVLEHTNNKILAISKYALLWDMFGISDPSSVWSLADWAHSYARQQLSSFVNSWFNIYERWLICKTQIANENLESGQKDRAFTEDRLFFLSADEIDRYYKDLEPSAFVIFSDRKGKDSFSIWAEPSSYWTRTLGAAKDKITPIIIIDENGRKNETRFDSDEIGWRPALWLNLSNIEEMIQTCQE